MKDLIILAIESSCDETAVAIMQGDKLLSNAVSSQIEMHAKYGGVMPEIASRLHTENILYVLEEALTSANIKLEEVDAFAVTRGPGLIGALHIGMQTAKILALTYNKPLIPVHHLAAHIYASEFVAPLKFPLLGVVVSGGNTEFVLMKDHLDFQIIGETRDDAIGECYDKVARVLGLGYPGGVKIDKLAASGEPNIKLPNPALKDGYNFSYAGLKTHVINIVNNAKQRGEEINLPSLCASFQQVAIDAIVDKALAAAQEFKVQQVVIAGGVSANSRLRSEVLAKFPPLGVEPLIPPLWCCTDQAAMIAKIAVHIHKQKVFANYKLGVDPNWSIEDFASF